MGIFNINIVRNILTNIQHGQADIVAVGAVNKEAIYKAIANRILYVSQQLVPVDTGQLKESGVVLKNSIGTYSVLYEAFYAPYVHEIIENYHESPTQSKFLEDAAWAVLNEFTSESLVFTFDLEIGDDFIALNIDSLTVKDFTHNLNMLSNEYNNGDLESLDKPRGGYKKPKDVIYYE